jgi:hypothetical protein
MRLLGFSFNKISAERLSVNQADFKELKINNNIDISSIEKANSEVFKAKDEELISVKFKYSINYEPNFAIIEIHGNILVSMESKKTKEFLKKWEDNKEMPEDARLALFNTIIQKSSIKALQLEDDMSFPFHMPFPKLSRQENKSN